MMLIKMQEIPRSLFCLMVDKDLKPKSVCNSLGKGKIQMSNFPQKCMNSLNISSAAMFTKLQEERTSRKQKCQ